MIKIDKPAQIPITLRKRGIIETRNDCTKVETNHEAFLLGDEKLDKAISDVYGSNSVKNSLIACHNGKCCYCERKRDRVEIDVEHFRPKRSVTENREDKEKKYPGYYWLAYNWQNLFLSCKGCNITWKGTSFPLSNRNNRSRWHNDINTVQDENPLLVNPSDEPRNHIRFNDDAPYPLDNIGLATIRGLGLLERVELREARMKALKELKKSFSIVETLRIAVEKNKTEEIKFIRNNFDVEGAIVDIETAILPIAEFSSMAIDFLNGYVIDEAVLNLIRN